MRELFVDEVVVDVRSGDGGAGAVSFRREKCAEYGGPNGGDGGRGGDVWVEADTQLSTLLDYRFKRRQHAAHGERGRGAQCSGAEGAGLNLRVPVGTQLRDVHSGELVADLSVAGQRICLARGGRGGKGNEHFKTSVRRAPKFAQPGEPGEGMELRFELKLMADVGLIGMPNVGKSSLVAHLSAARPRVADYPFTTLVPSLGVVRFGEEQHFVIADVPGLIAGAHLGHGLGTRFLRHVERVRVLVHVVTLAPGVDGRDPVGDFFAVEQELENFNQDLMQRPRVLVLNQVDRPEVGREAEALAAWAKARDLPFFAVSAASGQGLKDLVKHLGYQVAQAKAQGSFAQQRGQWQQPHPPAHEAVG